MKTIEQLLQLSKNPYYTFTNDEKAVLDDFLLAQREKDLLNSQKQNLQPSDSNTPVRVRNIVPKTIDNVKDAPEPTDAR
jgi:hypothetical protein